MLDFATARTNMVESQLRTNRVTDRRLIAAFETVPRENYVPESKRAIAYVDEDLKVATDRYMTEPMVLARLIEDAHVQTGDVALVVGAGTGYACAILANLAATVVGLESEEALADAAEATLAREGVDNAVIVRGKLTEGVPRQGPFNVIVIDGAIETLPEALVEQLADGGRLVGVRREGPVGRAFLLEKFGDATGERVLFDARTPVLRDFAAEKGFVF
jgi:protein-L-isoaspartate(D-aspartate) O-methyltransferase